MSKCWSKPIFYILVISVVVRIVAAVYWQSTVSEGASCFKFGDSDTYWVHAQRIATGEPYRYLSNESRIFRAPLFPLFLAPFAYGATGYGLNEIEGTVIVVRLVGSVLGTLCVGIIWWLTCRIAGERAADVAGIFAATYPGAIGMSVFVLSEMIFCPLMLASLACSYLAIQQEPKSARHLHWVMMAGILTGLGCLARPSWGLWAGLWWLFMAIRMLANRWHIRPKSIVIAGIIYGFAISAVMSPWWVRNYYITGKFVPSTLQVGASLYDGWHEGASGSSDEGMAFVETYLREQLWEDQYCDTLGIGKESTLEWRLDRRLRNAAIQWVRENPSDAIKLGMVKFWKTWRPIPVAKELGGRGVRYGEGGAYVMILGFGVLGVWASRSHRGAWLFMLPTIYFGVLHTAFIGSVRYRQPAVLVLCILAGCGVVFVLERFRRNPSVRPNE